MRVMSGPRIEQAVRRIETALTRIADIAERINASPPSVSGLAMEHQSLRVTVANSLKELDELLERLEK